MSAKKHRYRVTRIWGTVPPQVSDLVGRDDAYLVYPEYREHLSDQGFIDNGELVGGWFMEYAGVRETPL